MTDVETSVIVCKICKQMKTRYQNGMFDIKSKRWVDEHGKLFNGKVCPECHKNKVKEQIKNKRHGL